jgi:PHP family Zn ribbon phosphoesterase
LAEGRPTLNLRPLALLEKVLGHGSDCPFAPAHVFNPWFADLGSIGGETSLDELYVDFTNELLAVETGLTSIPPMCRRVSSLDRLSLFSCSDAHSLENLGREYTVLHVDLTYDAIFAALRRGTRDGVTQTVKFPLYETRYYLNWCVACKKSFDATLCSPCGKKLVTGSRDRLEQIADRSSPCAGGRRPTLPATAAARVRYWKLAGEHSRESHRETIGSDPPRTSGSRTLCSDRGSGSGDRGRDHAAIGPQNQRATLGRH